MLATVDTSWTHLGLSLAAIAVLVALSAAYSSSESILFSLSRMQVQRFQARGGTLGHLVVHLLRSPQRTLTVILLGNTTVNVLLYANVYVFFEGLEPHLGPAKGVGAALFSLLVVAVFGEALPKTVGVALAPRLAPLVAPLVHFSGYVLGPVSRVLHVLLAEPLSRILLGRRAEAVEPMSTPELKTLLEMSRRRGMINPVEDAFLREVIDLGHLRVRDVMVPRVEVVTYDLNGGAAGLRELMRRTRRKKVPVYEGHVDRIVGLVYAKVLFLNPDKPLRSLVQPVRFVPELARCEQLLHHFRTTRSQLAIAVDEYGGMAGLVTLEDVLEAIVGDLQSPDEAPEQPEIVQVAEGVFEVSGRLSIHYWSQAFALPRTAEGVATVGGLVTAELGRPAVVGDTITLGHLELQVVAAGRRRVERVRVRLLGAPATQEARP